MASEENDLSSDLPLESDEAISNHLPHGTVVDRTFQQPIIFSLLNKMNNNILSSNKLPADFLSQQKHVMPQDMLPKGLSLNQTLSQAMTLQLQTESSQRPVPRSWSTQIGFRQSLVPFYL